MNINQWIYVIGMGIALMLFTILDAPLMGIGLALLCGFGETIRVLTHIARGTQP